MSDGFVDQDDYETSRALDIIHREEVFAAPGGLVEADDNLSLMDRLDAALIVLSDRLPELAGRPEVQVRIHQRLDEVKRNIGVVTDELERLLLAECPTRVNRVGREVKERLVVDGVGVVEPIDRGSRWVDVDWDLLLDSVVSRAWAEGEIEKPGDVARVVSECIGFSSMKSNKSLGTGLVRYGLAREEFGTKVEGTPGVRIIPNETPNTLTDIEETPK